VDKSFSRDLLTASLGARAPTHDDVKALGHFVATCRDASGKILWEEDFDNLLTTIGKNFLLDQGLAGASYTAVDYMGLISSTSYTAVAAADTMVSHGGWLEAGSTNAPTYSGTRATCAWSAASGGVKALSAGLTFTFTGSGTVQGAFIVVGSGASSAIMNTGGTLYAAGALGTPQPVISTNTLTLSYSTTLT